jgi:myo-inositol 2-dehydrogenase / D-chiro-inositol 1-dehydrogenase
MADSTLSAARRVPGRLSGFDLALIGAGRMGQTHLRALAGNPAVSIRHVAERAASRKQLAVAGYQVHRSLDELLAHTRPDGVLVAVPTDQHTNVIRDLLLADVPVLCEKPAGLTPEAAAEAGRLAAARGVPFQVAYWRRVVPELRQLRERIAAGEFGDILAINTAQWDSTPPGANFRAGSGGIFVDMGVHEFDQIGWLSGQRITCIRAAAAKPFGDPAPDGDVDSAQALLELSGGATGAVSLGRHYPGGDMASVEIFGSRDHDRLTFLDPADGDRVVLAALARQAESFAEFVRSHGTDGAQADEAVTALQAARCASVSAGLCSYP